MYFSILELQEFWGYLVKYKPEISDDIGLLHPMTNYSVGSSALGYYPSYCRPFVSDDPRYIAKYYYGTDNRWWNPLHRLIRWLKQSNCYFISTEFAKSSFPLITHMKLAISSDAPLTTRTLFAVKLDDNIGELLLDASNKICAEHPTVPPLLKQNLNCGEIRYTFKYYDTYFSE